MATQEQYELLQKQFLEMKVLCEKLQTENAAQVQQQQQQQQQLAPPASAPSVVYLSKERKIQIFQGWPTKTSDPEVHMWLEDAKLAVTSMTGEDRKVDYLMDHLSGEAKDEVRMHQPPDRDTADKILKILTDVYSNTESVAQLQTAFFQRKQRLDEPLQHYSLELMKMMAKIVKKDDKSVGDPDLMLTEMFINGVRDRQLHRDLRRQALEHPSMKFEEFRIQVLKWTEEGSYRLGNSSTQEAELCNTTTKTDETITQMMQLMSAQQELMKNQQEQLNRIEESQRGMQSSHSQVQGRTAFQQRRGNIKCYACGNWGDHFARDCPEARGGNSRRSSYKDTKGKSTYQTDLNGKLPQ